MGRVQIEVRDEDIEGILEVGDSENFPLALTKKLSDINNLTDRSGIFSTQFKIPATKSNNELLEYIYDSNKKDYKNSFARKTVSIVVDGDTVSRGTLQIKSYIKSNEREFTCTYTSNNLEWVRQFEEIYLADIPFTNNAVTYTPTTIRGSWLNTVDAGDEWVFALINRGTANLQFQNKISAERFFPDVFVKPVLEKAFTSVDYTLESDFMDTDAFKKLIIPFFGDRFLQDPDTVDNALARGQLSSSDAKVLAGVDVGFKIPYDDDSTSPNTDVGGNFDTSTFLGRYTIPTGGRYRITVGIDYTATNTSTFDGGVIIQVRAPNFGTGLDVQLTNLDTHNIDAGDTEVVFKTVNTGTTFFDDLLFAAGDTVEIFAKTFQADGSPINISITHDTDSFFKVELLEGMSVGGSFLMSDVLDNSEFNMLSLVNDLTRMFNLYWVTDNATQKVKVEPRDDFYKGLIDAVDMTDKVDLSKGYELVDNASLYKQGLDFEYKEDGADGFVAERNKIKDDVYASFTHDFTQELEEGRTTITTGSVAATYFMKDTTGGNAPHLAPITSRLWRAPTDKDGEQPEQVTSFSPRILNYEYAGQTNADGQSRFFGFFNQGEPDTLEGLIPYALLYPYEENGILQADTDFNLSYGYDTNKDNLIEAYWSKTITAIEEGNRLTINMRLTPNDFRNIDFKTPIYFTGEPNIEGYWVFERIENYTPAKEQTTKVVLVKHREWDKTLTVTLRKDNTPVDDGITKGTTDEVCVFIVDNDGFTIDVKSLNTNNVFDDVCLDV